GRLPHLKGVVSYTYRHSFVTDALENGVGVAQVAELLGHTSTDMVMHHDQHLREKRDHLRRAAPRRPCNRAGRLPRPPGPGKHRMRGVSATPGPPRIFSTL